MHIGYPNSTNGQYALPQHYFPVKQPATCFTMCFTICLCISPDLDGNRAPKMKRWPDMFVYQSGHGMYGRFDGRYDMFT